MKINRTYQVVCDSDRADFEAVVSQRLSEGWECQGGVAIRFQEWENGGYHETCTTYFQAMVRTSNAINIEVTVDTKKAEQQLREFAEKLK